MKIILNVAALLLAVATAIPLIRLDGWWIRVFDFPRLQIISLGLLVLVVLLFFWNIKNFFEGLVLA